MRARPLPLLTAAAGLLASVVLAVVAAGCASGASTGAAEPPSSPPPPPATGPAYPTGPLDVVVDVTTGGGFVPIQLAVDDRPDFRLYGDGTVYARPPETEWVALPRLQTYRLSREGVETVLDAAAAAGLLGGPTEYGSPAVTDLPTTTVTIATAAGRTQQSAYALGFSGADDTLSAGERGARETLRGFVELLTGLPGERPELLESRPAPYVPKAVDVYAWKLEGEAAGKLHDWPLSTPLASLPGEAGTDVRCLTVRGDDVTTLLAALQGVEGGAPWRSGASGEKGKPWLLAFRLVLPGDRGCETG